MKKLINLFSLLLATLVVSSCSDDDNGPSNRIKVDGESVKFSNAYLITDTYTDPNDNEGYKHLVYLTGDGLTMNTDDGEFEDSGNLASFTIFSEGEEIEESTYTISDDGEFGDAEWFYILTGFGGGSYYDEAYEAVEGEIEVSRSGDTYIFKFDFHEVKIDDDEGIHEGEGSMTGSFTGKIEVFPDEVTISRRDQKNPLVQLFN